MVNKCSICELYLNRALLWFFFKSWYRNLLYKSPAYLGFGFQFALERIKAGFEVDLETLWSTVLWPDLVLSCSHQTCSSAFNPELFLGLPVFQPAPDFFFPVMPFKPYVVILTNLSSAPYIISFFLFLCNLFCPFTLAHAASCTL